MSSCRSCSPICSKANGASTSRPRSTSSISPTAPSIIRARCRAASSSASPSPAPSCRTRSCCSATSRPATSIRHSADEILATLPILNRDLGKTIVMVTHDPGGGALRAPHAAPRQGRASSRRSSRRERLRSHPQESVPQEAARRADDRLDPHRLCDLRRAARLRTRLQRGRGQSPRTTGWSCVNKINFTQPLPISYFNRVRGIEGVRLGHPRQLVRRLLPGSEELPDRVRGRAGDLPADLRRTTSFFTPEMREAFIRERTGALVGEALAAEWGWKVGDRIPIASNIFSQKNGSRTWDVTIVGIFGNAQAADRHQFDGLSIRLFRRDALVRQGHDRLDRAAARPRPTVNDRRGEDDRRRSSPTRPTRPRPTPRRPSTRRSSRSSATSR